MVSAIYEHECESGFRDYQCVLLTVFTGALPEHANALPRPILDSSPMNAHANILCHTPTHDVMLGLICSHKFKKTNEFKHLRATSSELVRVAKQFSRNLVTDLVTDDE